MTTTTRKTLETDKVVGEPVADPTVDQQGKAMDEVAPAPVPWSELAPSDYEVLVHMFPFRPPDEERQAPAMAAAAVTEPTVDEKDLTRAALLAAVLALADARAAHLAIEQKDYVFGLFVSQTAWVSKGGSQGSWPRGSIESSLQGMLAETPVKVRDLVAGWIGPERPDPWGWIGGRIVDRLVRQGIVERHQEKQSFLFFSWKKTTHRPAVGMEEALADYASAARRTGLGLPLLDRGGLRLAQGGVISGEIDKGFTDRTESDDYD